MLVQAKNKFLFGVWPLLLSLALILQIGVASASDTELSIGVYEDRTGALTLSDVNRQSFVQQTGNTLKLGYSSSAFWVRIELPQGSDNSYLSACYTVIDEIDAFIPENGSWRKVETGDARPFTQRDVEHPCFVFDLSNADQRTMYLRLASDSSLNITLELSEQHQFWQKTQTIELGHGICFAFLLAMILYNFFLFLVINESVYIYYVGYLGGITLFLAAMSGHAAMYLWPEAGVWNDVSPVVTALLAMAFGLMFVRAITQIPRFMPLVGKIMQVTAAVSLIFSVVTPLFQSTAIYLLSVILAISVPLFVIAIIISCMNRWKPAYFMLTGLLIVIPGIVLSYLRVNGLLEESWLTNNIMHFTTVVEAMLLSFALAYRIRMLNAQIEQHQQRELVTQSNLSRSLLKATDNERRAIARELHDHFGQGLLAVKNLVGQFDKSEDQQLAVKQLNNLVADSRNMARNMHPQQIENLGLTTAIKTMLNETLIPAGINVKFSGDDVSGWLSTDEEIQFYRIAQESVSNIVRHANAQQVEVKLHLADKGITLSIKDDGIGIDPSHNPGLGIANMQERAAILNAELKIQRGENNGTETKVMVELS